MRKLLMAGMATLLCMAIGAAPAAAKHHKPPKPPKPAYTYTAVIDCGYGNVTVGSYDDLWADLEDLKSPRRYQPVEWEVFIPGRADPIHEVKPGRHKKTVDCSYDDGFATGTVTVKKDAWFLLDELRKRLEEHRGRG